MNHNLWYNSGFQINKPLFKSSNFKLEIEREKQTVKKRFEKITDSRRELIEKLKF